MFSVNAAHRFTHSADGNLAELPQVSKSPFRVSSQLPHRFDASKKAIGALDVHAPFSDVSCSVPSLRCTSLTGNHIVMPRFLPGNTCCCQQNLVSSKDHISIPALLFCAAGEHGDVRRCQRCWRWRYAMARREKDEGCSCVFARQPLWESQDGEK